MKLYLSTILYSFLLQTHNKRNTFKNALSFFELFYTKQNKPHPTSVGDAWFLSCNGLMNTKQIKNVLRCRSKHIDIKFHFLRELTWKKKKIKLKCVSNKWSNSWRTYKSFTENKFREDDRRGRLEERRSIGNIEQPTFSWSVSVTPHRLVEEHWVSIVVAILKLDFI